MINSKDIKIRIDKIRESYTVLNPDVSEKDLIFLKFIRDDSRKSVQTQLNSLRKYITKIKRERARIEGMFQYENRLWNNSVKYVVGIDEAGRGPLAGPVVAAAVILPRKIIIDKLNDSKKVKDGDREKIYDYLINNKEIKIGVGMVSHDIIDKINILNGTMLAMKQAISELGVADCHLLVDGLKIKGINLPQIKIIKGDSKSASIASASIIAKVTRDRLMKKLSKKFPDWNFHIHKGYGTKDHLERIQKYGPSPIHRLTFKGVK